MIAPTDGAPPAKGETLGKFILYFLCAGQQVADILGYSPLPPVLVENGFGAVRKIPGAPAPPDIKDCDNPTVGVTFPPPLSETGGPNENQTVQQAAGKTGPGAGAGSSSAGAGGGSSSSANKSSANSATKTTTKAGSTAKTGTGSSSGAGATGTGTSDTQLASSGGDGSASASGRVLGVVDGPPDLTKIDADYTVPAAVLAVLALGLVLVGPLLRKRVMSSGPGGG
jgi:hypothetical protein